MKMMGTSTLLISVLVAAMSLQQTLSFRSSTSTVRSRMSSGSSSSRKFLSPAATDLGQFLSTSIATAAAEVASNPIVAKQIFEPQISTETGIGFLVLSGLITVTGAFWWTIIIPAKRTELALSKSKGEVKTFLTDLKEAGKTGDKKLERWMFSDWLNKTPGSQKPGALPFLKKAKWNSGDNPVLVAFGSIMACVIAASIGERISQ